MAKHGGVTQLVEYPVHTRSVTCSSQVAATRPVGQAVKTPPFHGGNMGSIPVRVTKKKNLLLPQEVFFLSISTESKRPAKHSEGNKQAPAGLLRWLLCLHNTFRRGSCQEYRGINRRFCFRWLLLIELSSLAFYASFVCVRVLWFPFRIKKSPDSRQDSSVMGY